jgi:ankyrin repeat protein
MPKIKYAFPLAGLFCLTLVSLTSLAQNAPSRFDYASYDQAFKAIHDGDIEQIKRLIKAGFPLDKRDSSKRTALHIAAFQSHDEMLKLLVEAGGDINALEYMRYDVITIAAVANDAELLKLAISLGGDPANVTSLYDGTALIAAAHLGHAEVVKTLLEANAPVDHVNNLGWTALLEAIILGDGSERYVETVGYLLQHKADQNLADRNGIKPLQHAKVHGYSDITKLLSD